jgi:hypothetical protein
MAAEGLIILEELRWKLAGLEEMCAGPRRGSSRLSRATVGHWRRWKRDKEAALEIYARISPCYGHHTHSSGTTFAATLVGLGTDELGPRFSTFYRPGVTSNE